MTNKDDEKTEVLPELAHRSAFDENTQPEIRQEIFDVGSSADFQQFFKMDRRLGFRPVTNERRHFLRPTPELRLRGLIAAIFVFATISVLCYFFAR